MDWHKHLEEVAILNRRIADLESQLAELSQGGEAVAEVIIGEGYPKWSWLRNNHGLPDGQHKLYTQAPAIRHEGGEDFRSCSCTDGQTVCKHISGTPACSYEQPPISAIPPGYVVVKSELFEAVAALVRFAGDWNQGSHAKLYRPVICRLVGEHITSAPAIQPQAASAPVAEQDWLPIETAPRDGTEIIALDAYSYRNDPKRRMHFVLRSVFFNDEGGWEISEDGEILDEDALTHWLPRSALPASPVAFAAPADSKEGE